MTAFLTIATAAVAHADTLNVNDVVTHGNTSVEQGASGTAEVYLTDPTGSPASDVNGCNATGSASAFVALSSSSPSLTIDDNNGASTGNVTLTGCGTTAAATVGYHVSESATVGAAITVSGTASGGRTGSVYTSDSFTVTVLAATPADSTPPQISYSLTGTAGANGWFTSNVDVDWTVTDPESAVTVDSGCVDQTISTETTGTTLSCSAHSTGGSASDSVTVKLDKTGPSAALAVTAGTAGANGWFTSNVTVGTSGSDGISGPVTCTADQFQTTETAGETFNGSCTNDAGLSTNAASLTVKLDKTGPSAALAVTAGTAGANGWFTSNVTVGTSGSDGISGPVTCTADQFQTTETAGETFNGSCTNDAGLSTNAASLTVKLDKTAPTDLAFTGGGLSDGGSYYFGSVPAGPTGCTADGAISGLDSCSVSGYSTAVGSHTVQATATDNAGNVATKDLSYNVLAWTISGFYAPVDRPDTFNVTKNGSTVPLKFEVFAGTTELTDISVVDTFTQKVSCASGAGDAIEEYTTGSTSLRYDTTTGQFIFNWKTPKQAGACYRVTMTTADGSSIYANFNLK